MRDKTYSIRERMEEAERIAQTIASLPPARCSAKEAALLEKLRIIRSGNTAILPTGEIVERGTPGSMDYESPNRKDQP